MIHFEWPWVLATLPLPFMAHWLLPKATRGPGRALRLPFYAELPNLASGGAVHRSLARTLLATIAWLLLVLAASRPQWLGEPLGFPVSGRDLMLAVDISGSMAQQDYRLDGHPASRLDAVKQIAGKFIEQRTGDRLGLILFGSRAYLQTPLTFDRETTEAMLKEAVIGLAGRETAIGDAIALAVKRLKGQPEGDRVLILLTDGANTAGHISPLEAGRRGAQAGVRIYTIGIAGGAVGVQTPFGIQLIQTGQDLDPTTLKGIAQQTGGRYLEATDTAELEATYRELDRLEPRVRDTRRYRSLKALYCWPAGAALLLSLALALSSLGSGLRRRRAIEEAAHEHA
jgi:Ca-activated chloride channel family protein